jgi:hypothetical protein
MKKANAENSARIESNILGRLLPRRIDNTYTGSKIALWIFGLVTAIRITQSILIIVNGYSIAISADGIPLDSFPRPAAQTIVAILGISSLNRLIISLICAVTLVRYRSAVPLMFIMVGLSYLGNQLLLQFIPMSRVGNPPGIIMNLLLFGLTIVGFALSVWTRR